MKILIAEDDKISSKMVQSILIKWEYEVIVTKDGKEAWEILQKDDAPRLVLLDWMMPEVDGIEVCKRYRTLSIEQGFPVYIIMLTSKKDVDDIVEGLDTGANDYISKPFSVNELKVRLNVGMKYLSLQHSLIKRAQELEEAIEKVKQLQTFLPICAYCKKIRDDQNTWSDVEQYIETHSELDFSRSICPDCKAKREKEDE